MAVSYSYSPAPFKDPSSGDGDVQNSKIALTIVTQRMGLFSDDEAIASELMVDLTKDRTVR